MRAIRTYRITFFFVSFKTGSLRVTCGFASGLRHRLSLKDS